MQRVRSNGPVRADAAVACGSANFVDDDLIELGGGAEGDAKGDAAGDA